ncbi:Uncharacterised protein [Chlamydia trachomatis]|nr:Uncharacterised protein [Chlamydia trachomatis]
MNEKIKGLEDRIQAYIDTHGNCDVTVEITKNVDFSTGEPIIRGMSWTVIVNHKSTD